MSVPPILFVAFLAAVLPFKTAAQGGFGGWGGLGGFASCAVCIVYPALAQQLTISSLAKSLCANDWGSNCLWTDGGDCFCTNNTLIANVNSCIASSSCGTSDKEGMQRSNASPSLY